MTTAQARAATTADLEHHVDTVRLWLGEVDGARSAASLVADEARWSQDPSAYLRAALSQENTLLVTGTYAGFPVGLTVARLRSGTDQPPAVRVEAILVDPGARGVGVGQAMLSRVLTWARSHSAQRVDVLALPGDRDTKNFFEGEGLKARLLTLATELD